MKENMSIEGKNSMVLYYFLVLILTGLTSFALGYLDYETRKISDLFTAQNLVALFLYFLPAFIFSALFLNFFSSKYKGLKLLLLSYSLGTILGFAITFTTLYLKLRAA